MNFNNIDKEKRCLVLLSIDYPNKKHQRLVSTETEVSRQRQSETIKFGVKQVDKGQLSSMKR